MAIKKLITNEKGASAEYWNIPSILIYDNIIVLNINGFISHDYREKGLDKFVLSKSYKINKSNINIENNIYRELYNYLKNLDEFKDSEDC